MVTRYDERLQGIVALCCSEERYAIYDYDRVVVLNRLCGFDYKLIKKEDG